MGTGICGNEALHAEIRGVFRQVSFRTFRLKLDLVKLVAPPRVLSLLP